MLTTCVFLRFFFNFSFIYNLVYQTDWNDGHALCFLVSKVGGLIPNLMHLSKDKRDWESNVQTAINSASALGIQPLLKAKHIAEEKNDHAGIMAYVAKFRSLVKPKFNQLSLNFFKIMKQ